MNRALVLIAALALLTACAGRGTGPYAPQSESARDPAKAQQLTMEAAAILSSDPKRAEALLRQALTADLYHGPAHNNLGVLYLKQEKFFEAASEFEWSAKLLPGHPDPRLNLALTLERAGRTDAALAGYGQALEVYPNHLPTLQAKARLQVRAGKTDDTTRPALEEIALRGQTPQWRDWARRQLVRGEP